ncbi:hypothetical protein AGABI1DRAFT_82947 [Agaricus bisporus var. burnettii JB137-S8]|uniref:Uncharacterized protein n=1 Tax=Agaricus bisporus var. burnettii (strain JB137-S8 / ATCC MYA-4627 / FGSC 10392) TaxID=597362 RepID=K5XE12_AGABU|nr:uncharacterized protein AGABI1DRAFT_82947 [Agaricus bisporus var. burnettii JB137-S8]EKM81422.1 hypothetical protein AGABI1DRAFT_82947 [Agaricus bisporus var. burnettii JB137-S8]
MVLFYATFLSIIAYRQRIQLNPAERVFNLKTFMDGWLLAIMLILAIAVAAVFGNTSSIQDRIAGSNLGIAYEVFGFLASLDVAVSAFMARARLSKANIHDKIINISAFAVGPIVVAGGIFRIINVAIQLNARPFYNRLALLIATVAIEGTVSIAAVYCCLLMGAPPKAPKADGKGAPVEKKV